MQIRTHTQKLVYKYCNKHNINQSKTTKQNILSYINNIQYIDSKEKLVLTTFHSYIPWNILVADKTKRKDKSLRITSANRFSYSESLTTKKENSSFKKRLEYISNDSFEFINQTTVTHAELQHNERKTNSVEVEYNSHVNLNSINEKVVLVSETINKLSSINTLFINLENKAGVS